MRSLKTGRDPGGYLLVLTMMVPLVGLLAACGTSGNASDPDAWQTLTPTIEAPSPAAATAEQTEMPAAMGDVVASPQPAARLTTDQLLEYGPNELGAIPVLEYHVFVTDPDMVDDYSMTIETFNAHLQWLYDHDFFVIPMADFVRNEIAAPSGKHPVVLSFDDGSAGQFRFIKDRGGKLVPDPDSAVGAMEAFFAKHPDFGRGGFFSVLPFNCFAEPTEPDQMPYCDQKLVWLAEHGYELGNHTTGHQDLLDVTDERFMSEVGGAVAWVTEHTPAEGDLGNVIAMPYGNYPDADLHPEQRRMMREGFEYEGTKVQLEGALMVGANPSESPSSALWDPLWIPRIQTSETVTDYWFTAIADGSVILYVSDGNPDTVTVPDPLPPLLDGDLDTDVISRSGKELIQYDPDAQASAP